MISPIVAALASHWIEDGTIERIAPGKRAAAAVRQQIARECLAGLRVQAASTSYHLWLHLGDAMSSASFVVRARARPSAGDRGDRRRGVLPRQRLATRSCADLAQRRAGSHPPGGRPEDTARPRVGPGRGSIRAPVNWVAPAGPLECCGSLILQFLRSTARGHFHA
jgi:hypothetical protein